MLQGFLISLFLSWRGESWFHKWLACWLFSWTDRTPFKGHKSIFIISFNRTLFLLINYWLNFLQRFFQELIIFDHLICWSFSLRHSCILVFWYDCHVLAGIDKSLITNCDLSLLFSLFITWHCQNFWLLSRCRNLLMKFKLWYSTCCNIFVWCSKLFFLAELLCHLLCRSIKGLSFLA